MNFLIKDKYRTKIMQHVLHQYNNQYNERNNSCTNDHNKQNNSNIVNSENENRSQKLFEKVSKRKALINDDDNVNNINKQQDKQIRKKFINNNQKINKEFIKFKYIQIQPRNHLNTQQLYTYHQKIPLFDIPNHQQHQQQIQNNLVNKNNKNSNSKNNKQNKQNNNKQNRQNNNKQNNQDKNKQNNKNQQNKQDIYCPKLINIIGKNLEEQKKINKDKKYKFITANKVQQILNTKRLLQKQQQTKKQNLQIIEQQKLKKYQPNKQQKQIINQFNSQFNKIQTHRSKGSTQMMQFLQSARQKLFHNIHQIQLPKQQPQSLKYQQQQSLTQSSKQQSLTQQQQEIKKQIKQTNQNQNSQQFKIQIQVSQNKTCEIILRMDSNAQQISNRFILQNKQYLQTFNNDQLNKLRQLLTKKICLQIQKHKQLCIIKQNNKISTKYQPNKINHNHIHELLYQNSYQNNYQNDKINNKIKNKINNKNNKVKKDNNKNKYEYIQDMQFEIRSKYNICVNKQQIKRNKNINNNKDKRLQYEHIYVQNIDTQSINYQDQFNENSYQNSYKNKKNNFVNNKNKKNNIEITNKQNDYKNYRNNKINNNPQLKKIISFNPTNTNQNIFKNNNPQTQISLNGYLNSPHQLISYRPQQKQNNSQFKYKQTLLQKQNNNSLSNISYPIIDTNKNHIQISHFPLTNSLPSFNHQLINYQQLHLQQQTQTQKYHQINNFKYTKTHDNHNYIGASKILSKSRSKLINKFKTQLKSNQQPKLQPSQNIQSSQYKQQIDTFNNNPITSNTKNVSINTKSSSINNISQQIISRLGKDNILNSIKQKQISKKLKILKQKQQKQTQLMKQCSFKPKINNLSKYIDQNKKKKFKITQLIDNNHNNLQNNNIFENTQTIFKSNQNNKLNQQNCIKQENNLISNKQCSNKYFIQNQLATNMQQSQQFDKIMIKLKKSRNQTNRYQQLYDNYKDIQARKQYNRQKSLQQISFKPQINKISAKIIQTKRNSLHNSTCQQFYSLANSKVNRSRHQSTCKKQKRGSINYSHYNNQENGYLINDNSLDNSNHNHKKRISENLVRNLQGLQIGEYLYKQAMRLKKKKDSLSQSKVTNVIKPLQKSQKIINKIKQKRLNEYFNELLGLNINNQNININNENKNINNENKQNENIKKQINNNKQEYEYILKSQNIDLDDNKYRIGPIKYLLPLLQQLKQLQAQLTRQQFIQSGLKLINYLSQDQKAQFLMINHKKYQFINSNSINHQSTNYYQSTNNKNKLTINNYKEQLLSLQNKNKSFYLQDIYHRGLLYKKLTKDKVQIHMENKVRKQLEKCTFKPKINSNYKQQDQ